MGVARPIRLVTDARSKDRPYELISVNVKGGRERERDRRKRQIDQIFFRHGVLSRASYTSFLHSNKIREGALARDEGGTRAGASETIRINASYVDAGDFKINTVVIWRLVGCSRRRPALAGR